jgi:hypothetical protein
MAKVLIKVQNWWRVPRPFSALGTMYANIDDHLTS